MLLDRFRKKYGRGKETETTAYFHEDSSEVVLYQYMYDGDKVIGNHCITIPIKDFASITKLVFGSYMLSKMESDL